MERTPLQAASPSRSATVPVSRQPRCVLVVSTVDHAERELLSHLSDADTVKIVVPVVRQGVLDWLANDEDAFGEAQRAAEETAAELPGEAVEAVAGEADIELAIRDALATFPADEIVIAVRPPAQRGAVESAAAEPLPAGSFDGIPVRQIVMLESAERGSGPPAVGMSSHRSSPERVDTPTTRAARTPILALGGTVVVIALVFALALALAALAYVLAS